MASCQSRPAFCLLCILPLSYEERGQQTTDKGLGALLHVCSRSESWVGAGGRNKSIPSDGCPHLSPEEHSSLKYIHRRCCHDKGLHMARTGKASICSIWSKKQQQQLSTRRIVRENSMSQLKGHGRGLFLQHEGTKNNCASSFYLVHSYWPQWEP